MDIFVLILNVESSYFISPFSNYQSIMTWLISMVTYNIDSHAIKYSGMLSITFLNL